MTSKLPVHKQIPSDFTVRIGMFNEFYQLGKIPLRPDSALERLKQFQKMLKDEVEELQEIIDKLEEDGAAAAVGNMPRHYLEPIDLLVELADFLGDVQVYCASEMPRWGIPADPTLKIIMQSNMSKADENGKPIIKDGKVQKGPNYWKPEPKIKEMLLEYHSSKS